LFRFKERPNRIILQKKVTNCAKEKSTGPTGLDLMGPKRKRFGGKK